MTERTLLSACLIIAAATPAWAQDVLAGADPASTPDAAASTEEQQLGEEEIEVVDKAPPGARAELTKEALEREEHDDLHKVLRSIAGVYLRDEDGYGLRPNIGMRGAAADRSAKVTLMEDGVLIAPAALQTTVAPSAK